MKNMKLKNINKKMILKILGVFTVFSLICLIYAHYEYTQLQVKKIVLKSKDIPKEFDGKKILFLADFQLDTWGRYNKKQMDRIVNLVNSQEKDIILVGGDYTNWTGKIDRFYNDLKGMEIPKYGTYAILGNHDYNDVERNSQKLRELGYNLLVNENSDIKIGNEKIFIAGVDDYRKGKPDAEKALNGIKKEDFAILLNHNPDYFEEMTDTEKEKADITLSGHTRGGQITFFGYILHAEVKHKKYAYGMKESNGHKIYTTSGVGGGAFEMFIRFFAKPEIVVFELRKN